MARRMLPSRKSTYTSNGQPMLYLSYVIDADDSGQIAAAMERAEKIIVEDEPTYDTKRERWESVLGNIDLDSALRKAIEKPTVRRDYKSRTCSKVILLCSQISQKSWELKDEEFMPYQGFFPP
jgi:hypothetical protein